MKQKEAEIQQSARPRTALHGDPDVPVLKMEMLDKEFDEDGNEIIVENGSPITAKSARNRESIVSKKLPNRRGAPIHEALYIQSERIQKKKEEKAAKLQADEQKKL